MGGIRREVIASLQSRREGTKLLAVGLMTLSLSILDLVPVSEGSASAETLGESLRFVRSIDTLGYRRIWYAEHHNMPSIASTTPAILIARAAAATAHIRVGAGGIMLPNHAPLQVAESFKLLEALHPGRIDLGIGRAPGTDPAAAAALRGARAALSVDDFPEQLASLMAFGADQPPTRRVRAFPDDVGLPPIWLLGSSDYSSRLAARLGTGFAFAAHFSPDAPEPPMLAYRELFCASSGFPRPHAILTLSVICADSSAEAERLATSMQLAWARLRAGRPSRIPPPSAADARNLSAEERAVARAYRTMQVVGTAQEVQAQILTLAARTQADEVMITTVTHDPAARLRSYQLLAEAFALTPAGYFGCGGRSEFESGTPSKK